ncbi:RNA-binding S4 domain-containing protein [Vallitaleaceae bacterium 9-2]
MKEIKIDQPFIKLGQVLKLAGIADSGSYAKLFISDGLVQVNGEVDTRRGRKVYPGDVITFEDQTIKIVD